MESRAKLFGHPIHPMLIVFPLGLLATSFIFDIVFLATEARRFTEISFYMIGAGIIGGLIAAVFGLVDFLAIPSRTRAKRVGALHGITNVTVVGLFAVSWALRYADPMVPGALPIVLSGLGVALALVGGWLGGELVDRLGVGVSDGANVDAPSSLRARRHSSVTIRRY